MAHFGPEPLGTIIRLKNNKIRIIAFDADEEEDILEELNIHFHYGSFRYLKKITITKEDHLKAN